MATFIERKVVLEHVGSTDYTSDSRVVTKTATMRNGSILEGVTEMLSTGTLADVDGIINDPKLDLYPVGAVVVVAVVERSAVVDLGELRFQDTETVTEANAAAMTGLVGIVYK